MTTRPNVLVFGGMDSFTQLLALHLLPPVPSLPLVNHLRIVDRFLVNPPTTSVSNSFLKLLKERANLVEYRQANLTNPSVVAKCFNDPAPNGLPYTHIFDLTGELVPNRPVEIHVRNSFNVSLLIAKTSAAQMSRVPGSIKAHVRVVAPWYDYPRHDKLYKETEPEGWKPADTRVAWWHESLRAIGTIEGLPLVGMRCGLSYGEGYFKYEATSWIHLGLIYKHLGREMKLLWSPDLPKSCANSRDVAGIMWKAAEWVSTKSRREADAIAGVSIPPSYDDSVTSVNCPDVILPSSGSVVVPAFNMVDEGKTTQATLSDAIGRVFGIKTGFLDSEGELFDGKRLSQVIEEATEVHLDAWAEIITKAKPPVPNTPLSPFMPPSLVAERACAIDGERVRTILNYKFQYPRFNERSVHDYINWCRSEGIWPETDLYTASQPNGL